VNIDSISNGIVIDHITAGRGMKLYQLLGLGKLDCSVAIIKNAPSHKQGRKDIIKIDSAMELDLNILGFIDPEITVNIIKDGALVEKKHLTLPKQIRDVLKCKNPRCITSVEQELPHIFNLTDPRRAVYRCVYCETKAE
jgi:aspartate carbamoyltransferase regulatory subunit